jgi:hypothetical protein
MTGRILEFRSIKIIEVEKIHPHSGDTVTVLEMDENSIEKHKVEISFFDLIRNGTWLINFFLSIMITAVHGGIVFAAFSIFVKNSNSDSLSLQHIAIIIISSAVLFLGLWVFFSIRGGIAKIKREFVIAERGDGNWKIINENKYDNFYRLLLISKKKKDLLKR